MIGQIPQKTLASAVMVIVAFICLIQMDLMWMIVNIVLITMMMHPDTKYLDYRLSKYVIDGILVTAMAGLAVVMIDMFAGLRWSTVLDVSLYTYIAAAIQSVQSFIIGLILAIYMRHKGIAMTKYWLLICALAFAVTCSAADMFVDFIAMYVDGYPVFNEDFFDADRYTNSILMAMPMMTVPVTIILSLAIAIRLRGRPETVIYEMKEGSE